MSNLAWRVCWHCCSPTEQPVFPPGSWVGSELGGAVRLSDTLGGRGHCLYSPFIARSASLSFAHTLFGCYHRTITLHKYDEPSEWRRCGWWTAGTRNMWRTFPEEKGRRTFFCFFGEGWGNLFYRVQILPSCSIGQGAASEKSKENMPFGKGRSTPCFVSTRRHDQAEGLTKELFLLHGEWPPNFA